MPASAARTETPAKEAWGHIWRIFQEDKPRRMAIIAELGLSFQQAMALSRLEPDTPLPMSALATSLQCDNSNVTGIVDRLENAGLAERRPAEHDRRVKMLSLTPEGAELRERLWERLSRPPEAIAALPAEDARALRDILRRALDAR